MKKVTDHMDIEDVAGCSGLLKMEEVIDGDVVRQTGSASREAHGELSFAAAERTYVEEGGHVSDESIRPSAHDE